MKAVLGLVILFGGVGLVYLGTSARTLFEADAPVDRDGSPLVTVQVSETLTENAKVGANAFAAKCSACHGENAVGQDGVAPPLVHKIYEPSHHADESFQRAVAIGVRQHHWSFGNMPPVEGLTRGDVAMIVTYIRELQRANGIN